MSVVDDSAKNEYAYVFTNYFCLYLVYIYKLSEQILISIFFFFLQMTKMFFNNFSLNAVWGKNYYLEKIKRGMNFFFDVILHNLELIITHYYHFQNNTQICVNLSLNIIIWWYDVWNNQRYLQQTQEVTETT